MNPHNEYSAPNSETLFPRDFKNEDISNAITCMRKSNNFMQSNCSSPFLKFSSINSINFPVAAIWSVRQSKRPFLLGRKGASGSWAEPYFACPTLSLRGFAYPPGILYRVFTGKKEEYRIPGGILYRYLKAYRSIQPYANK
ncbi:hypothetical protein [Mucilaginibacter lappiensis]|uniref:Uncharacterized protein n=1 Tax=Mucilaginibacter lappiensis TaxID=354630 RepID=A0A841JBT0_9SPHI|nr:hypothetical protein [Mucilaginibacter lappiensis]MBB6128619.1 hypothetical protein [Mucilaginibacter lappiensis]